MAFACHRCAAPLNRPARYCPRCGCSLLEVSEFRIWQRGVYRRQAIFCGAAIPIGLLFLCFSPATTLIVSGLGMLGLIVSLRRLERMRIHDVPGGQGTGRD